MSRPLRHAIQYPTQRADTWRTYWRGWAKLRLWRFQLLVGVLLAAVVAVLRGVGNLSLLTLVVLALLAVAAIMFLFPLALMVGVKPVMVTLTITPDGWAAVRANARKDQWWADVRRIEERKRGLYIESGEYLAFVIPWSAFSGAAQREQFVSDAKAWHLAALSMRPGPGSGP